MVANIITPDKWLRGCTRRGSIPPLPSMIEQDKLILDLCGGTGNWSKPYVEAGYEVIIITKPSQDVRSFVKGELIRDIYGILAAPPCTHFSLARTTAKTPRDLRGAMEVVKACLEIIWKAREQGNLKFWCLENPKGLLRQFLGKPAFSFDASEFGENYNKATDLWGYFNEPRRLTSFTRFKTTDKNTRKLPNLPDDYIRDPEMNLVAMKRAITPKDFAASFFKSNQ
jgi:hypothetical protein